MVFPRNPRRGRGRTITTQTAAEIEASRELATFRTLKVIIDKSGILN
ncbi:MAG: hypothetical protein MJE68_11645 [Proteobacteria bacterium]|nr:hypothetical protein [Pseudomonadota bacterium]